jgi:hypothetical protein
MAFRINPGELDDWLEFLDTRALHRVPRQIILISLPILSVILYLALIIFGLFPGIRSLIDPQSIYSSLFRFIAIASLGLVISLLVLIILLFLFKLAKDFAVRLYRPLDVSDLESRIWHRLLGWHGLFNFSNYVVINEPKLAPTSDWSTWLGGPASLFIYDGFAVYLERGNCFSRVVGAGFPIPHLDARETIKAIVDLRPHIQDASANAWTKDGIKTRIKVRVAFQIDSGDPGNPAQARLMYPYNPVSVRKAVEYTALRLRKGKFVESDWCEGAMGIMTGLLSHHITSHHLDELFMANMGDGQMLSDRVMNKLFEDASVSLKKIGVSLNNIQITDIEIPDDVRRQRLNTRHADKESMVIRIQGEAQAYGIRISEETRAKSQRDLIISIAKSLQKIEPSNFPEPLLLSLSSLIDQGLGDPFIKSYLGKETLVTIEKLRDMI